VCVRACVDMYGRVCSSIKIPINLQGKHNMHLVGITRGYHMPRLLKGKRKKSSNISQPSIVYDYSEMEEFVKVVVCFVPSNIL
jgi:hypothetical protein